MRNSKDWLRSKTYHAYDGAMERRVALSRATNVEVEHNHWCPKPVIEVQIQPADMSSSLGPGDGCLKTSSSHQF